MRSLRASARAALAAAAELIFPRFCLGCSRPLGDAPAPLLLCPICRGGLARIDRRAACSACARPLPKSGSSRMLCLSCRQQPPPFERLIAPWHYAPPLDRVIRAMKFSRLDFLAAALVDEALGIGTERPAIVAVVPVPMPLWRRIERGFNQAELLARCLAERLRVPCIVALRRPGLTATPQRRLAGTARRHNRELRFEPRAQHRQLPQGAVLLVDDVTTTGSTLRAAARTLRSAGHPEILAWAVAATPPGDLRDP